MKGSSEGKAAAHPERRERSRSRDATVHVSHCTKGSSKGKAAATPNRRERSRSRDVARPQGEAVHPHIRQDEVQRIRQIREATRLSEQICCRDLRCGNHSFEVFVADPNRPELAELMCVECGTITGSDLERRLMYSQRSSISNNSSRRADVRREQRGALEPESERESAVS